MRIQTVIKYLLSYMPTPLPVGMAEFQTWADSIIELAGPYADPDSMRFAMASMIQHADSKHSALSKQYFVRRLRKVASNQIAAQVFMDIKEKQIKKLAEDTAKQAESSDVPNQV